MLPVAQRLKKTKDIQRLLRGGQSVFHRLLSLKVQKSAQKSSPSKVLFTVSTKVDKRSVYRNRLRRRAQSAMRNTPLLPGYHVAIILKSEAKEVTFQTLLQALQDTCKKANILK